MAATTWLVTAWLAVEPEQSVVMVVRERSDPFIAIPASQTGAQIIQLQMLE